MQAYLRTQRAHYAAAAESRLADDDAHAMPRFAPLLPADDAIAVAAAAAAADDEEFYSCLTSHPEGMGGTDENIFSTTTLLAALNDVQNPVASGARRQASGSGDAMVPPGSAKSATRVRGGSLEASLSLPADRQLGLSGSTSKEAAACC